jgi:prepilin-type N-terminal cleavage/methylation domain-containing protein
LRNVKKRGFSLIEIMIVILIMGVLVGVIGSLMGGFVSNFEITDDQTIARRRAQDVFNILQIPIQNAGLGLPADKFDYYFDVAGAPAGAARVRRWWEPVSVDSTAPGTNNVLRIVYSVPTRLKSKAGTRNFSAKGGEGGAIVDPIDTNGPQAPNFELTDSANIGQLLNTFVTFPGIHMHPVLVTAVDAAAPSVTLDGRRPKYAVGRNNHDYIEANSSDIDAFLPRNAIYPYHDMFSVKAGVAFVDTASSVFVFADDILSRDITAPSAANYTTSLSQVPLGFRVEGVKAIEFDGGDLPHTLTVRVVTEGDSADSARKESVQMSAIEKRWKDDKGFNITFDPAVYYEEFAMSWRTRNVETPPQKK